MVNHPDQEPVSVILIVYNEAATIGQEILNIKNVILAKLPGSELIIAEDGSTDGTKEIIAGYLQDPAVIHSTGGQRKGYAKALKDAMNIAKNPYIFFSDTGSKFDMDDFWKLYERRHEYELVIGVRTKRSDQLHRRFLTLIFNFILRKYFKVDLQDADSGFRIYNKALNDKLCSEDWMNTALISSELTLRAIFSGVCVGYVGVHYRQRLGMSRGLPLQKMPAVILGVLKNFPRLRNILSSAAYPRLRF
ncbi:MAG: glycosyltransferase family 2 protein [Smithella sp.]